MKFFLDTANIDEIREASAWGQVDGVTTNPTLIAKEGRDFRQVILEIAQIVDGPISAEALSLDAEKMIAEGRELASWHEQVVVKLPLTIAGLQAVKALAREGIRTNVTLAFSANQALLAARAGATYISPFVGRLDDEGHDGMALIQDIRTIYDNYGFETDILAASIRHPLHVTQAALAGADVATMPIKVLKMMYHHPLTDTGIARFLADWEQARSQS
ncbi:MAG: fructose-6-phosphate aldolase [bacterium]|nr:fructose-6-phosphate aldolase [bacterium]